MLIYLVTGWVSTQVTVVFLANDHAVIGVDN